MPKRERDPDTKVAAAVVLIFAGGLFAGLAFHVSGWLWFPAMFLALAGAFGVSEISDGSGG